VVDDLLGLGRPRPSFPPELAAGLRRRLEHDLAPLAEALGDDPLWIGKRALSLVHTCEAHYLAEQRGDGFEWTIQAAEGEVAHRALERTMAVKGDLVPLDLVDHAVARLTEGDDGLARFLRHLPPLDEAELRALATRRVTAFVECWPRLSPRWSPRTEASIRAELCGGRVVLSGKPDLALGVARGQEAHVLIIDLKAGGRHAGHVDDLRFYALVQTLRIGVPPFRVATYYLETADFRAEDVTAETLETAARRTVDGARKMARLRLPDHAPTITPGRACGWCSLRHSCEGPSRLQAELDGGH
jgi:hypothetical protein